MDIVSEVRHTTFFRIGGDLAVFARKVVDVEKKEVLGYQVALEKIPMAESMQVTPDIIRHFWVVTEYPPELLMSLAKHNHAVRGTSRYRVGQPDDRESLQLLRWAEEKVKTILFPEVQKTEPDHVLAAVT